MSSPPLHPLNHGFAWPDRPLTGLQALSRDQVAQYNAEGFCVLAGALPPETVHALLAEIDPIEERIGRYVIHLDDAPDIVYDADNMTFAQDLVRDAPAVRNLCGSPLIQGIVHDLIGPAVRLYWNQAVYKKPSKGQVFPWHQDNGYTFVEPQDYLTAWIALSDATIENGCPWVLPRYHRQGTLRHVMGKNGIEIDQLPDDAPGAVATPAAAGDIVLFSSLTPHRTGANVSATVRKALILQFAPEGTARVMPDGARIPQDDPLRNMPVIPAHGQAHP